MKKNHKRISAAVLSLALGFTVAGAPMLAPVASAQISADQITSVRTGDPVSLTINKYTGNPVEEGQTPTSPDNELLGGVTFTVEKVSMNNALDTIAGWEEVNDIQESFAGGIAPQLTGDSWSQTTPTTPNPAPITFDTATLGTDFGVGLYLVTESHTLAGYTVAKPFLVALPYHDGSAWTYARSVSPKNQIVTIEKSVDDEEARLGKNIEYTISASIPAEAMGSLVIKDELPSQLGPALLNTIVVKTTGVTNPGNADITLAAGDYTVVNDGPNQATTDNDLTITLESSGLQKINDLRKDNPGLKIAATFEAEIVALPTNGVISNDAIVNYPGGVEIKTADSDGGTETRLGTLTVTKVDENNIEIKDPETLANADFAATFELWRCSLDNGDWKVSGTALPVITDPDVDTSGELPVAPATLPTTFSTDPDTGIANVYGVQAFDFVNNADLTEPSNLCLYETKAPKGYQPNPRPIPVQTYANETDHAAGFYAMTARVTNIEDTITGQLPETGGNGTMALIGAGVLVAAAGGVAAVRGNRARNK